MLNITGEKALGLGSVFDNLHHTDGVRFLFFGTRLALCGTHEHYIEEEQRVPYRYDMDFYGKMTDYGGNTVDDHRIIYVKYRDVKPGVPRWYEDKLIENGYMKECKLGASTVFSITENDMYREMSKALKKGVNVFLAEPYDMHPLVKDYQYGNITTVQ